MQYSIVNIICKSVKISGILYVVNLDHIENFKMKESEEMLRLLLSNNYLSDNLSLFVIYNRSSEKKEMYEWMTKELMDSQINIDKIERDFQLYYKDSNFHDCGTYIDAGWPESLPKKLEKFVNQLIKLRDST